MAMSALSVSSSSLGQLASTPHVIEVLRVLRQHDDPVCWEAPPMFDRTLALLAFRRFVTELELRLEQRLDYEASAGSLEASFHGEVFLLGGALRFSNFGRMVAFISDRARSLPQAAIVASLLTEHRYVLIPSELLERRYNGRNTRIPAGATWRARFFDYV